MINNICHLKLVLLIICLECWLRLHSFQRKMYIAIRLEDMKLVWQRILDPLTSGWGCLYSLQTGLACSRQVLTYLLNGFEENSHLECIGLILVIYLQQLWSTFILVVISLQLMPAELEWCNNYMIIFQ